MSSTALQKAGSSAIESPAINYNSQQLQLIKDTYAKGASDQEFQLFVQVAQYRKLDILKRQICLVGFYDRELKRKVFQPITTIDGYRSKAEETGEYEGQTAPQWCGKDGAWRDVWLEDEPPAAARIGVYRKGWREALYAVARWKSYAQTYQDGNPSGQWGKMPDLMLAKCAESLALRKAFPEQLGGLYTEDEMQQAEINVTSRGSVASPSPLNGQTASTAERVLNDILLKYCLAQKGDKNGKAYYESKYGKFSFDEKQKEALRLNLEIPQPASDVVIEAEPAEETLSV